MCISFQLMVRPVGSTPNAGPVCAGQPDVLDDEFAVLEVTDDLGLQVREAFSLDPDHRLDAFAAGFHSGCRVVIDEVLVISSSRTSVLP